MLFLTHSMSLVAVKHRDYMELYAVTVVCMYCVFMQNKKKYEQIVSQTLLSPPIDILCICWRLLVFFGATIMFNILSYLVVSLRLPSDVFVAFQIPSTAADKYAKFTIINVFWNPCLSN